MFFCLSEIIRYNFSRGSDWACVTVIINILYISDIIWQIIAALIVNRIKVMQAKSKIFLPKYKLLHLFSFVDVYAE